jgi:hypothetical protein
VENTHLTDIAVIPSADLVELQYQIVRALKWRRRQLLQLKQIDGKKFWVDLAETSSNTSSIIIQVRRPLVARVFLLLVFSATAPHPVAT